MPVIEGDFHGVSGFLDPPLMSHYSSECLTATCRPLEVQGCRGCRSEGKHPIGPPGLLKCFVALVISVMLIHQSKEVYGSDSKEREKKAAEDIANRPDREIMERIFGKRVTKEPDSIVEDCRKDDCFEKVSSIIKASVPPFDYSSSIKYVVISATPIQTGNVGPEKSSTRGAQETDNQQVKVHSLVDRHSVRIRAACGGWRDWQGLSSRIRRCGGSRISVHFCNEPVHRAGSWHTGDCIDPIFQHRYLYHRRSCSGWNAYCRSHTHDDGCQCRNDGYQYACQFRSCESTRRVQKRHLQPPLFTTSSIF